MPASNQIKIGFVLHVMQVAGAEVLVAEIIRSLRSELDPLVLCLDGIGELGEQMQREGIRVVALGRREGLDLRVATRLAEEIDNHGIEVLHAHQYTPFFYSALAKIRAARKFHLIFTEHGRHFPDVVSLKRRLINRIFLRHMADKINGVCQFSARALRENDGFIHKDIEIIENGINADRYGPPEDRTALCNRLGMDPARRYIACIARFHPVKDHQTLIRAFSFVSKEYPDADLLLVGDGPLRSALEQQVVEFGINQRVKFLGVRPDVPDLLRISDIFILTSVSEAASLTLLEAMAAALPVVVTKVGGNPEIVREGVDGFLIHSNDVLATSEAICKILADSNLARRMGASGHSRILAHYSLQNTINRYHELYAAAAARIHGSIVH
jgi:N-acetyl-alpha-D-glucosaminyl L-malate synthase BshA